MSQQVDTLTASYGDKWEGVTTTAGDPTLETESAFVQMMSSNDLWPVVLGVSLIIWFVLLFFVLRLERRLQQAEASTHAVAGSSNNSTITPNTSTPSDSPSS
jgi:hypothetical protein